MSEPLSGLATALRSAVDAFLQERLDAKLKGLPDDDPKRAQLHAQFERRAWIADAARRVAQIQLVTHTLKATHPDARGTSLYAPPATLRQHALVGSHCLGDAFMPDVVGNAVALDVNQFLRVSVDGRTLLDRMVAGEADLAAALGHDEIEATAWIQAFLSVRQARGAASSHTLAKQLYWLVGDDPCDDREYHLLAPIHASSLSHEVYQTLQNDRFGDAAQAARQARREKAFSEDEVHEYPGLAVQKLGGTKPQNLSQLNSERRGTNYLLASLPPQWTQSSTRPPLHVKTIFDRFQRRRPVKALLRRLEQFLEADPPRNEGTRDTRDDLVDTIIDELLELELELRLLEPGWSASPECRLPLFERCWLDADRAARDEDFAQQFQQTDWPGELCDRFANWLNGRLEGKLNFDDATYGHWHRRLRDELRASQREGLIDV